jgi:hypothetical protein
MSPIHHRHHGSVSVGRIMVVAGCFLVLVANTLVFKEAAVPPPLPLLKVIAVMSLVWMFAGAWSMCTRTLWARFMVLIILYAGSLGFFLAGVITMATDDGPLVGRVQSIFIATAVYLYVSLVFTHSKHVRRLTSRAWE